MIMEKAGKEQYPSSRPKFWAMQYIRAMTKTCAANEVGSLGAFLCSVIATTEDASGYRRAVTYWDGQLLPITGAKNEKAMALARTNCVKAGWLHYEPGTKARPGKYWTTMPLHAVGIDDHPTDEGEQTGSQTDHIGSESGSQTERIGNESGTNRDHKRNKPGSQTEQTGIAKVKIREAFLPIPIPIPEPIPIPKEPPNPQGGSESKKTKSPPTEKTHEPTEFPEELDTPEFRATWAEWIAHRIEIRKPMKPLGAKKLLKSLAEGGERKAIESINQSIANGWQGVFEVKAGCAGVKSNQEDGLEQFLREANDRSRVLCGNENSENGNRPRGSGGSGEGVVHTLLGFDG